MRNEDGILTERIGRGLLEWCSSFAREILLALIRVVEVRLLPVETLARRTN